MCAWGCRPAILANQLTRRDLAPHADFRPRPLGINLRLTEEAVDQFLMVQGAPSRPSKQIEQVLRRLIFLSRATHLIRLFLSHQQLGLNQLVHSIPDQPLRQAKELCNRLDLERSSWCDAPTRRHSLQKKPSFHSKIMTFKKTQKKSHSQTNHQSNLDHILYPIKADNQIHVTDTLTVQEHKR